MYIVLDALLWQDQHLQRLVEMSSRQLDLLLTQKVGNCGAVCAINALQTVRSSIGRPPLQHLQAIMYALQEVAPIARGSLNAAGLDEVLTHLVDESRFSVRIDQVRNSAEVISPHMTIHENLVVGDLVSGKGDTKILLAAIVSKGDVVGGHYMLLKSVFRSGKKIMASVSDPNFPARTTVYEVGTTRLNGSQSTLALLPVGHAEFDEMYGSGTYLVISSVASISPK